MYHQSYDFLLSLDPSLDVRCLFERYTGWYLYDSTTGELSSVPVRSICGQKRAADGSIVTCKAGEVPVTFGRSLLMTMSETRSAAEGTGSQIDESAFLHSDNVSESRDDKDGASVEQILDLQDLSDQTVGGVSAVQHIKWLCEKARLDVPTTILGAQILIVQRLAGTSGKSISSPCLLL